MTNTADLQAYAGAIANSYGIDQGVFNWQIGQESSWNPNAVNTSGSTPAIGIAQFQPNTASQFGIDPTDPYQSIAAAGQYDSQLLSANGGNYLGMLQSYGTLGSNMPSSVWQQAGNAIANAGQTVTPPGSTGAKTTGIWSGLTNWISESFNKSMYNITFLFLGIVFIIIGGMVLSRGSIDFIASPPGTIKNPKRFKNNAKGLE